MSKRAHSMARKVALLLVAVLLTCAFTPHSAYAQTTATIYAKVKVFQQYKVQTSGLQNTFEYVIERVEPNAPLPKDANGSTYDEFSLTRDQEMWLEFPIEVTVDPSATPYIFHYVLKPAQTTLPGGLYYVDMLDPNLSAGVNEYLLEIHVQPSSVDASASIATPIVRSGNWNGDKVTDPGWRIAYKVSESSGSSSSQQSGSSSSSSSSSTSRNSKSNSTSASTRTSTSASRSSSSSSSTGSQTTTKTSTATTQTVTQTSRSSLAQTGDSTTTMLAVPCAVLGMSLILLHVPLKRKRAGEDDA